jgi:hypothetical protein
MKKIFYLLIAVAVFGLIAISTARAEDSALTATAVGVASSSELEKISSPDQIKNFKIMKKIGDVLYGVRKGTSTEKVELKEPEKPEKAEKPENVATSSKLEKIDHPGLVNLYEKIQKIGTALWGIRKKATSTPLFIEPATATCVAAAIDVKDKVLIARVTAAAAELNTALTARSVCQQTAVIATTTPREALNSCVKTFNETQKAIKEASKKIQNDAWKTYQESLKACRTSATSTSPVPMIEDGGNLFD